MLLSRQSGRKVNFPLEQFGRLMHRNGANENVLISREGELREVQARRPVIYFTFEKQEGVIYQTVPISLLELIVRERKIDRDVLEELASLETISCI